MFTVLALIGVFVLYIGFATILTLYRAWAAVTLWSWFAVPIFGLPILGYAQMIGLTVLVGLFMPHPQTRSLKEDHYKDKAWEPLITVILSPAGAVSVGWVIKTWFM